MKISVQKGPVQQRGKTLQIGVQKPSNSFVLWLLPTILFAGCTGPSPSELFLMQTLGLWAPYFLILTLFQCKLDNGLPRWTSLLTLFIFVYGLITAMCFFGKDFWPSFWGVLIYGIVMGLVLLVPIVVFVSVFANAGNDEKTNIRSFFVATSFLLGFFVVLNIIFLGPEFVRNL